MMEGTAPPFLPETKTSPDITKPIFKFERTDWIDPPTINPINPEMNESIYRRQANDALYRQISSPSKWQKYVTLGYFAIDDGALFDLEWSAREANPTKMNSIIWYNYLYHIDREIDIPTKLNVWATQVSQPFLIKNAPHLLITDTHTTSWQQTQVTNTPMEVEEDEWTEVISTGKAKASKRRASSLSKAAGNDTPKNVAAGFNLPDNDVPLTSLKPNNPSNPNIKHQEGKLNHTIDTEFSPRLNDHYSKSNTLNSAKRNTEQANPKQQTQNNPVTSRSKTNHNEKNEYTPHPNKKINDGTHRITLKWKLEKNYLARLEENEDELLNEIYQLITHVFDDGDGLVYPWKSKDPQHTQSTSTLKLDQVKDIISPNIAFIKSTSLLIFGLRFGFNGNPSAWKFKPNTQQYMKSHHFNVSISNSTCDSGNMVTVGYILLKAPNTTNTHFYLQHLINKLPDNTPFFDIIRLRKTPMDQEINHLGVQCGEQHAIPLCQALSQYLTTGNETALFLPRFALGAMTDDQVKQQFELHERYTKSLRALSLFPQVSNLDRIRTEIFPDGTQIKRSTREWAASLKLEDNSSALCDVVNGGPDRQATLLLPSPFYDHVKTQYTNYKTRLNPTKHREARYHARIPDLPAVIHITANVQSNLDFIKNLDIKNVWQQAIPQSARNPVMTQSEHDNTNPPRSKWSNLPSHNRPQTSATRLDDSPNNRHFSVSSNLSHASEEQSSAGSTKSMTRASNATYQARIHELEAILHKQQKVLDSSAKTTSERLSTIERQFQRLDNLDKTLTTMEIKLDHANKRQETQSILLKSMQTDTQAQFKDMGTTLLKSITSQSKLGGSMLDMQIKMEKITELMEKLNNRLDKETITEPIRTDAPSDPNKVSESSLLNDLPDTQSLSLTQEQSQASQSVSSGSFTDTCFHSPQKKKVRSPGNDDTDQDYDEEMQQSQSDSDDESYDDNTTITSVTSKQRNSTANKPKNKRLHSQKETKKSLAAIFNKVTKTRPSKLIKAPPNAQYISKSDSDGADPS
jgi:hypothetical protein